MPSRCADWDAIELAAEGQSDLGICKYEQYKRAIGPHKMSISAATRLYAEVGTRRI